jgi:uncharacterized protein (TIGR01777 family)
MKVIVAGGSGYVGRALVASLRGDGHEVVVVSREPATAGSVGWESIATQVEGADAVVNLAGVPIGGPRWTAHRKAAILESRVETTRTLAGAIEAATIRPGVLVTASGIDYYGDSGDDPVDESAPAGTSFLARVCVEWEAAGAAAPVRHVAIRTPVVIGRGAQATRLLALPFRLFVGGALGNGRQLFPWIHLDDLVGAYRLAIDDASLSGPVNAVASQQLRQREAARDFGAVLRRPALVPTPALALRLILGEQSDLLLHGQRAVSRKLRGLDFRYRALRAALEDAIS